MPTYIEQKFGLSGKVALVTGSSQGIGRAMALALAKAGADVIVNGRDGSKLAPVIREIEAAGARAEGMAADMGNRSDVDKLIARAIGWRGRLDILVNNAGVVSRSKAEDETDANWDRVFATNVHGLYAACRAAGRHMLERGSGKVINTASLLTFFGGVFVPAYSASKGAVGQITKALSNEWAPRGVQVNAIAPGYINTPMSEPLSKDPSRHAEILSRIPAGRWGEPADLEGTVVFLASSASDYLTGQIIAVDGGWCAR